MKLLLVGVILSLVINFLNAPDGSSIFPFQVKWWTEKIKTKGRTKEEDINMTMFERFMSYFLSYMLIILVTLILS